MAAWSRLRTSFSSLPTTSPSSSTPSSSSSLHPALLFDLADDLWFYRSVVPLPSLSLSCLPTLFSSSPDSSTLIAQCMINSSSSSSSSPPNSQPDTNTPLFLHAFAAYPAPPDIDEDHTNTFCAYEEIAYGGYNQAVYGGDSSSSDSDKDEDAYWGYPRASAGEDEDAYYYYTATSDWDDEDSHHGYHAPSDCEDEPQVHVIKEEMLPADAPQLHAHLQPDDALSGIYDVGVLLKDQHQKRTQEVTYSRFQRKPVSRVSAHRPNQGPSDNEQGELKESIKLWAHLVASTLPWKAAAQARPLL